MESPERHPIVRKGRTVWWGRNERGHPSHPIAKSGADVEDIVVKIEEGDHGARFLSRLGDGLLKMHDQLHPELFRRAGRVLLDVIDDPDNWPRTKLRAMEAAIVPLRGLITLVPELAELGNSYMVTHIENCCGAFYDEIGDEGWTKFGDFLAAEVGRAEKLTGNRKQAENRVAIVKALMKSQLDTLKMMATLNQIHDKDRDEIDPDDPRLLKAQAELAEMEREIDAEIVASRTLDGGNGEVE